MQVCTSLQADNHASTPAFSFFTGRMPFLPPNRQHRSTKDNNWQVRYLDICLFHVYGRTGVAKFAGVVKDAVEKLKPDDCEDNDHEEHQESDLQQRRHRLQNRLENYLQT